MSTYASIKDVENYIEGWVTSDPFALERLIQRCEQDLDLLVTSRGAELPPTQVIFIGGTSGLPTGGDFTLSLGSDITSSLPYNPTAVQVENALEALPSVGLDSNSVPNAQVLGTNPYTVVWTAEWVRSHYFGVVPPVTVNGESVYPINYDVPLLQVNSSLTPVDVSTNVVMVRGRKVNPLTDLDQNQVIALSNATCAQVEYRTKMGEKFFVRAQHSSVKGPDFTTSGKLPMVAPKAKRELAQSGLLRVGGRAYAGRNRRGVARGWPTY